MNLTPDESLTRSLSEVGLKPAPDDLSLPEGIHIRHWASSYAHFYLAEIPAAKDVAWGELLAEIDHQVLKTLRQAELKGGGVIDAHVCFLIEPHHRASIEKEVDERMSRHVTRKYWIERRLGIDAILSAVTVLAVPSLPTLDTRTDTGLSIEEQEWAQRILDRTPAVAFAEFLDNTGCAP